MPAKKALKSRILDQKDKEILMILQENGRESITNIAKKVGLAIDSVYNRFKAMKEKGVFYPRIYIDPQVIGYNLVIDVRIKLSNISLEKKEKIIKYLTTHPNVTNFFSITGKYDFLATVIAKDASEFDEVTTNIRNKYKDDISDWETTLFLKTYKIEEYDLLNKKPTLNK